MIESFSLKGISKSAAVFDMAKLTWMNGEYIGRMTDDALCASVFPNLVAAGLVDGSALDHNRAYLLRFFGLMKSRMKRLSDFVELGRYFFKDPVGYEEKAAAKHWSNAAIPASLRILSGILESLSEWSSGTIEKTVRETASRSGLPDAALIHSSRLAVTGFGVSPGLFELMEVLGKETVVRRLCTAALHLEGSGKTRS
jgi:glutamyl/glutaminyl-tRNA synthetase